jgi:large subunit ribosomal protein L31
MKKKIHPNYELATVTCACGEKYQVYSTTKSIFVETCRKCSPVFTGGETKAVIGQVEKFLKRKAKISEKKKK